jgi:hypothetical protein
MMDNCTLTLVIQKDDLAKGLGIADSCTKKGTYKVTARKKIWDNLKKSIDCILKNDLGIEYPIVFYMHEEYFYRTVELRFHWSNTHWPKYSRYENVYDFQSMFELEVLHPLIAKMQEYNPKIRFTMGYGN